MLLDTTALLADPYCNGTAWRTLAYAKQSWGIRILVTEVSLIEAAAGYKRRIGEARVGLSRYTDKHEKLLGGDAGGAAASAVLDDLHSSYPDRLDEILSSLGVEIIPVSAASHADVARRASERCKPCNSNGDGYRDTVNWLTIIDLLRNDASTRVAWVSNNSNDFGSTEDAKCLHSTLIDELRAIDAEQRFEWNHTTADQVIALAARHSPGDSGDARALHERLKVDVVMNYIQRAVFPPVVHSTISPGRCGLPFHTQSATIQSVEEPRDVAISVTGATGSDQSIVTFELWSSTTVEVQIGSETALSHDDEIAISALSEDGATGTITKDLLYRGIVSLDARDQPFSGEVTSVKASPDDPGLLRRRRDSALSANFAASSQRLGQTVRNAATAIQSSGLQRTLDAFRESGIAAQASQNAQAYVTLTSVAGSIRESQQAQIGDWQLAFSGLAATQRIVAERVQGIASSLTEPFTALDRQMAEWRGSLGRAALIMARTGHDQVDDDLVPDDDVEPGPAAEPDDDSNPS